VVVGGRFFAGVVGGAGLAPPERRTDVHP
jgi:hypothetical protein